MISCTKDKYILLMYNGTYSFTDIYYSPCIKAHTCFQKLITEALLIHWQHHTGGQASIRGSTPRFKPPAVYTWTFEMITGKRSSINFTFTVTSYKSSHALCQKMVFWLANPRVWRDQNRVALIGGRWHYRCCSPSEEAGWIACPLLSTLLLGMSGGTTQVILSSLDPENCSIAELGSRLRDKGLREKTTCPISVCLRRRFR